MILHHDSFERTWRAYLRRRTSYVPAGLRMIAEYFYRAGITAGREQGRSELAPSLLVLKENGEIVRGDGLPMESIG